MKSIQEALETFEKETINQFVANETGDYRNGNKIEKHIRKSIEYLKKNNSIDNSLKYVNHQNLNTKIWAASYLLNDYKIAADILEEVSHSSGIHSLIAKTTLSEWKKGNLKF
jgi:hypothetical protein